jgi:hypothetical protein
MAGGDSQYDPGMALLSSANKASSQRYLFDDNSDLAAVCGSAGMDIGGGSVGG